MSLSTPIRYSPNDPIESWLHQLLCLDVSVISRVSGGCPPPSDCELYHVNRDTLFCYHRASEEFLHRLMSLYVSSHYKNTPNDLQLLSDAPAHNLFVLLGPVTVTTTALPEILCVIQVIHATNVVCVLWFSAVCLSRCVLKEESVATLS